MKEMLEVYLFKTILSLLILALIYFIKNLISTLKTLEKTVTEIKEHNIRKDAGEKMINYRLNDLEKRVDKLEEL